MKKRLILIICLITYFIIVFGTEYFYRDKLYKLSLDYIKTINQKGFFNYFYFFWSVIYQFFLLAIGLTIPLLFFPIHTGFTYISIITTLTFSMTLLKSLYSQSRPFWDIYLENRNETSFPEPTECDSGYGNPSGHALSSTFILFLWDLFLCSHFFSKIKKKNIIKFLTLFLSIISIIFVCYSRINRQVHSFNQIIFGSLLGIGFYFMFCHILNINKISKDDFMINLDKAKFIIIPLCVILYSISITLGLTIHNDKEKEYESILMQFCNYEQPQFFGKQGALHSSIIFSVIGGYIGLLFLKYKIQKDHPNDSDIFYNWNQGSKCATLKIILFSFVLPYLLLAVTLFVPFDYYILKLVLLSLTYLIAGFLSFGLCFYYGCYLLKKEEMSQDNNLLIPSEEVNNNA